MFGGHTLQLSWVSWRPIGQILELRGSFIFESVERTIVDGKIHKYKEKVHNKSGALTIFVRFIYGTALDIARTGGNDYMLEPLAYGGLKRKHAHNFLSLSLPCGLIWLLWGPIEGRRHN